ncbi:hypothetical protein GIB67_020774 [Kingdonia uniflora]|uniref:imidazoleglycerol-phosphate dehydratase n=1 Tax=Kingdonia uniflora TaxID=39325 RepID=A0A7J7M725_9MAGN|nr:hypothetical protein GIB67_020774 [Kingdonia uniflora]
MVMSDLKVSIFFSKGGQMVSCTISFSENMLNGEKLKPLHKLMNLFGYWAAAPLASPSQDSMVSPGELNVKLAGKNSHHIIEATFKAFARSLRQASEYDLRRLGTVPRFGHYNFILNSVEV